MRVVVIAFLVFLAGLPSRGVAAPTEVGPLVIDEVFLGGAEGPAFLGSVQWIELTNAGPLPVALDGLELVADDRPPIALEADATLPAGGVFVLLITSDPTLALSARAAGALDFPLQAVLAEPLSTQTDALTLRSVDLVLDWLPLEQAVSVVDLPGAAFSLDPAFLSPQGNNEPSHWCASGEKTSLLGLLLNGTPGLVNAFCDNDGDGYSEADGDCADDRAGVHPSAAEVCDGVDNDCNGQIDDVAWLDDAANGACLQAGVCFGVVPRCLEAAWSCPYPTGFEGSEATCDGLDNDCDGQTDEGLTNACGLCGALPGEVCDGLDNDCDGVVDEGANAPDEACPLVAGVCAGAAPVCAGADGWRCGYGPAYEADESLCDGLDNDCDGQTDESFPLGGLCVVQVRACEAAGMWACSDDHHGVACVAPPVGQGPELCGDGTDNDCDGQTDEDFPVGSACEIGTGACRATGRYACTVDDLGVVCDATPLQPAREVCDDLQDNDCDGQVDETDCAASDDLGFEELGGGAVRCSASFTPRPCGPLALLLFATVLIALRLRRRA